ncbi:hypothetical protein YDYSY3_18660 [Paenibacillus chitinolyticus]|nr:hypothetical protein YDYSY3_18660 [Paenibacillus chitinolyticus]
MQKAFSKDALVLKVDGGNPQLGAMWMFSQAKMGFETFNTQLHDASV